MGSSPYFRLLIIILAGSTLAIALTGKAISQSRRPSTVVGPFTLGGTIGLSTEGYSANGISARRPNGSGRFYGKTTADAFGAKFGLDFLLSTEDDRIRQSLNQVTLRAAYRQWNGAIGDIRPSMNKYGVNGSTIRGLHAEYTPGNSIFSFIAGRSLRAIDTGIGAAIRRPAFDRNMFIGRAGIGQKNRNYAHLVALIARDQPGSLPASTLVRPTENVAFTPQFGLRLLENTLAIEGEVTASAFTRDTRAARSDEDLTPTLFGLFTPRIGSRFDYASAFSARYTVREFPETMAQSFEQLTLLTSYERIEPGFVSLGRPYTRSDQAVFRFQPQAILLDNRLQVALDFTSRRNNLDNFRNATLKRRQIGITTQAQLSPQLFVSSAFTRLANINDPVGNDAASLLLDQRLVSSSFTLSPVLTTSINNQTHRFALTSSFLSLSDKTDASDTLRTAVDFDNTTSTLNHSVILPSGLSLNNGISFVSSRSTYSDVSAFGLNAGASYGFLNRKLTLGLNGGISRTKLTFERIFPIEADASPDIEKSTQLMLTLNGAYRFTVRDVVRLTVRGLSTNQPLRGNFSEMQSTIRFEHRF